MSNPVSGALKWINPVSSDHYHGMSGVIHSEKGRVYVKRAIAAGLLGGTIAATLIFLQIIPTGLSQTYRAIILGATGGAAAIYCAALTGRAFANRQPLSDHGWDDILGEKHDNFFNRMLMRFSIKSADKRTINYLPAWLGGKTFSSQWDLNLEGGSEDEVGGGTGNGDATRREEND